MNNPVQKLVIVIAGALLFAGMAVAQKPGARCHILLLDSSGSMKGKYDNNLRGWLIEPLLNSGAFAPGDQVVVRWFHQRGNTAFDPNDPLRRYNDRHDAHAIAGTVPTSAQANGKNTDLPEALDLALADIRGLKLSDDVLMWMITDNDQDAHGLRDADGLYKKINADKTFRAAYLFPLTRENGKQLSHNDAALVMYLLHYSTRSSASNIDSIADGVGSKIGNDPITWIPFEGRINIDEANITVNSEPAQIVDGKLFLPAIPEGVPPEFSIQFKFRSRLRGRDIEHARITDESVVATLPSSLEPVGNVDSWRAAISPPSVRIKAKQQSSGTYTATVGAPDLILQPASFWNAVWGSESDPVDATLQLNLIDTKTRLDVTALSQVTNLANIQNIVQQSQQSKRPITIPMTFRVTYETLWRRAVAALLGVLALLGIGGCASLLFIKKQYKLTTRGDERILALPMLARSYISINGENAAMITRRFGKLTVLPLGIYQINGGAQPVRLKNSDSFLIHDETGAKQYPHQISSSESLPPASAEPDPFYD